MYPELFDDERAAECAAFLLHCAGGQINGLKLTKLLYLAERESYATYGEPLTGDMPYSFGLGPVLSNTYDHTKGKRSIGGEKWGYWVSPRQNNTISLKVALTNPSEQLLQLSESDLEIMESVWQKFGHMTEWELVDYTHENCPEWSDPGRSSVRIELEDLLSALGYSGEEIEERREHLRGIAKVNKAFAFASR